MEADVTDVKEELAQTLFDHIPVGVGSQGIISTSAKDLEAALEMGMDWSLREVRLHPPCPSFPAPSPPRPLALFTLFLSSLPAVCSRRTNEPTPQAVALTLCRQCSHTAQHPRHMPRSTCVTADVFTHLAHTG